MFIFLVLSPRNQAKRNFVENVQKTDKKFYVRWHLNTKKPLEKMEKTMYNRKVIGKKPRVNTNRKELFFVYPRITLW